MTGAVGAGRRKKVKKRKRRLVMAKRYLKISTTVTLVNPTTEQPMTDVEGKPLPALTMLDFIKKVLFADARWTKDFLGLSARESVLTAFAEATAMQSDVVVLAEEDWKVLEGAVKTPSTTNLMSGQTQAGYGGAYLPVVVPQFMPLMRSILDASTKSPATLLEVRSPV
jgi:hypothetical protein